MNLEDDPLQAALATAFADSSLPHRRSASASSSTSIPSSAPPEAPSAPSEEEIAGGDESWKEEYDHLLSGWRAESAAAREKAEQERERWKVIREKEEQEERERAKQLVVNRKDKDGKEAEWETVERARKSKDSKPKPAPERVEESGQTLSAAKGAATAVRDAPPRHASPSPADTRDLVAGETPRGHGVDTLESLLPRPEPSLSVYAGSHASHAEASVSATAPPSNADDQAIFGSRTWEEVPSLDSSFPSLSFPDRSASPSPELRERPPYQQPPAPPSVTLAIFDSSLSTRTRVLALVSSLAINMFLPFVNGVMLGFGEIFAKNVVGFFGWKIPGITVGLRAAPRRKQD